MHVISYHDNTRGAPRQPRSQQLGRQRQPHDRRDGVRLDQLVRPDRGGVPGRAGGAQEGAFRQLAGTAHGTLDAPDVAGMRGSGAAVRRRGARVRGAGRSPRRPARRAAAAGASTAARTCSPSTRAGSAGRTAASPCTSAILNRNYREQPGIPVGPDNFFSPGEPDRGQPGLLLSPHAPLPCSRSRRPEGDGGPPWRTAWSGRCGTTAASRPPSPGCSRSGRSTRTPSSKNTGIGFGRGKQEWYANQPPKLTVSAGRAAAAAVGQPLVLTAVIEDDELPSRLPPQRRAGETAQSLSGVPALQPPAGARPRFRTTSSGTRRPRPPAQRPVAALVRLPRAGRRRDRPAGLPALGGGAGGRADRHAGAALPGARDPAATSRPPWPATAGRRPRSRPA